MPILIFYNPANPQQQYMASTFNDPNIPAGYLYSQGSDGAIPAALQTFSPGVNNQGAGMQPNGKPPVVDVAQATAQPNWPNGILNSPSGNKTGI